MDKLDVINFESYLVSKEQHSIPDDLIERLYCFLVKSYHLADQEEFERLIIQPGIYGELTVLFGMDEHIAGLARTVRQQLNWEKHLLTAYTALIYLNPQYKVYPTVESMGLSQGVKESFSHPQDELIYVAFTHTPATYDFVYQFNDYIYPRPSKQVPDPIISVINSIKKQNGWVSTSHHPMVVNSTLVPLRCETINEDLDDTETSEFYLRTNPDFMQGNSLLTYIPLHLAHINYGLLNQGDFTYYKPPPKLHSHQLPLQKEREI